MPHVSLPQKWKNYCLESCACLSSRTVTNAVPSGMIAVNLEIFKALLLVSAVPFTSSAVPALQHLFFHDRRPVTGFYLLNESVPRPRSDLRMLVIQRSE